MKSKQISQATVFKERRLAEMISLSPSSLEGNPDLVPLLAILQEREDLMLLAILITMLIAMLLLAMLLATLLAILLLAMLLVMLLKM